MGADEQNNVERETCEQEICQRQGVTKPQGMSSLIKTVALEAHLITIIEHEEHDSLLW